MVEKDHPALSVTQQCRLLSIPRSTFYHAPRGETAENLALMRRIDEQFLQTPFYGVRQMTWHLRGEGETREPQAGPASDAAHGSDADLPAAEHERPVPRSTRSGPTCCAAGRSNGRARSGAPT